MRDLIDAIIYTFGYIIIAGIVVSVMLALIAGRIGG